MIYAFVCSLTRLRNHDWFVEWRTMKFMRRPPPLTDSCVNMPQNSLHVERRWYCIIKVIMLSILDQLPKRSASFDEKTLHFLTRRLKNKSRYFRISRWFLQFFRKYSCEILSLSLADCRRGEIEKKIFFSILFLLTSLTHKFSEINIRVIEIECLRVGAEWLNPPEITPRKTNFISKWIWSLWKHVRIDLAGTARIPVSGKIEVTVVYGRSLLGQATTHVCPAVSGSCWHIVSRLMRAATSDRMLRRRRRCGHASGNYIGIAPVRRSERLRFRAKFTPRSFVITDYLKFIGFPLSFLSDRHFCFDKYQK